MTDTTDVAAQADQLAAKAAQARADAEAQAVERFEAEQARAEGWAEVVLARFDDDDAELRRAEGEAERAFTEALLATDWAQSWVAARAARLRREALAHEATAAATRLNVDRRIPSVPYRDPRLIETLTEALEQGARGAAADVEDARQAEADEFIRGDRPDDAPATTIHPELLALLAHPEGCPQRVEAVTGGARCVDCQASHITPPPPEPLPPPDSAEYARLWRTQPFKIAEALDPADRANPQRNPLHPGAPDDPPGYQGGRPTPYG